MVALNRGVSNPKCAQKPKLQSNKYRMGLHKQACTAEMWVAAKGEEQKVLLLSCGISDNGANFSADVCMISFWHAFTFSSQSSFMECQAFIDVL